MNTKYSIEFFLEDPEFIRWVKNPDKDLSAFWTTFMHQHPQSKPEMLKAIKIVRSLKIKRDLPKEELKQEILKNVINRFGETQQSKPQVKHRKLLEVIIRYAAVVVLLIGSIYFFNLLVLNNEPANQTNSIVQADFIKETAQGSKIQTRLPDGSTVWLNAGTKIRYFLDTLSKTRNVSLSGEAFFDVVSNAKQPFIVISNGVSVKAIGTSFNVQAYPGKSDVEVSLLSGKVLVSNHRNEHEQMELSPGEKAIVSENNFNKQKFDYALDIGWKDGILSFKGATFDTVKEKLERWYGVTILVNDSSGFDDWQVDGEYENLSLEMILQHLSYTKDFQFSIEENEVYITK